MITSSNACPIIALLSLAVAPVLAQDEESQESEEKVDEIIVTGSRLITSRIDSPSPVLVIDATELKKSGVTTLGEFSRYLPQNALAQSDSGGVNKPLRGSAGFNLRGIGTDATLTLLNGRRIAPYGAAADSSPFVDINAIPVAAIERIEILKDGASAIYGSEAVAGVVNIITRRDFDYIVADVGYLVTTEGDGEELDLSIAGGWSGQSTSIAAVFSYFDRAIVWNRDREFSREADLRERGGRNARSEFSSPPTVFLLESESFARDPACPEQTDQNSQGISAPSCLFNFAPFNSLQQPTERLGLSATLDHDFHDSMGGFLALLISSKETSSWGAPTPVFPIVFVPEQHPQNPFGEDLLAYYRLLDTPSRETITESDSWRVVAGLKGKMAKQWNWEVALTSGANKSRTTLGTAILGAEFQDALLGFGGPNGDQYYNPFGLNPQNPPEVLDGFLARNVSQEEGTQESSVEFQLTNKSVEMGGGPLGIALGIQARRLTLEQSADELLLNGELLGSLPFDPLNFDRDIIAGFIEALLPWHEKFETQLALRYDHYSDFGGTLNPKVGVGWRPVPDLLVRASWGTSFRPPTFRELYDPPFSYVDISGEDPYRCPVTGSESDCVGHVVEIEFRGNPDLEPDEGETWGVGIAWEPDAVPGFSIALDWWSIEHTNRITESGDYLIELLDPADNPFVIRAPPSAEDISLGIPGLIIKYADTYFNGDSLKTQGVDLDFSYSFESTNAGLWRAGLNYSYLDKYELGLDYQNAQILEDFAGGYMGFDGGLPRHRALFRLEWAVGRHDVSAMVSYTGRYDSPRPLHVDGFPTDEDIEIASFTRLDLAWNYRFERLTGSQLQFGCHNCTDKYPRYNYMFGAESYHESRGAMVFARWSQEFGR
jgi:iron complex outermembrane receptor protein